MMNVFRSALHRFCLPCVLGVLGAIFFLPSSARAALLTLGDVETEFRAVFGRPPKTDELNYWKTRRVDKPSREALRGAMGSAKAKGKTVAGSPVVSPNDLAKLVPTAFSGVFRRAPNKEEKTYWVDRVVCRDISSYEGLIASLGFHKVNGKTIGGGTKEEFCTRAAGKRPGVTLNGALGIGGHRAGPLVRIGVVELPEAEITAAGKFFLRLPNNAKKVFAPGERLRVAYHEGVYVVRGPKGFRKELDAPPTFVPIGGAIMEITNYTDRGGSGRNYNQFRGSLEVRANSTQSAVWVINALRVEDYVKGLGETTDNAPEEFQKALAIAARTYVLYHHQRGGRQPHNGFDIGSTPNDQIYRGYVYEQFAPGAAREAAATRGQVLTADGQFIAAVYFSRSDGRTRSATEVWKSTKFPYLQGKDDPYGGTVLRGHGAGMSAQGAIGFARREGWDHGKILRYYYTGVKLERGY